MSEGSKKASRTYVNFSGISFSRREKIPSILQSEQSECGLACIAMIASYHGYDIDLASLRRHFPVSASGLSFDEMAEISGDIGLNSRALRADIEELGEVSLPCVIHWGGNHFVVLKAIKNNYYSIVDPEFGERKIKVDDFRRHFTGVLLELYPSTSFAPARLRRRLQMRDLWSKTQGLWLSLSQILLLSLLVQALTVISPLYIQIVVDMVLQKNQAELLKPVALGFSLVILTQALSGLLRSFAIFHLSSRLSVQMGANLFRHLIRLPLNYFIKRHLGDISSRFDSLQRVREMMTNGIVRIFLDGLMALVTLGAMLYYSPLLSIIACGVVVIYVGVRIVSMNFVKQMENERVIASAVERTHFLETLRVMQTIKVFQKESDRQTQWLNKLVGVVNKEVRAAKWNASFTSINTILFGLENIVIIYFCVILVKDGSLSLGMFFAFLMLKSSFVSAINNLISLFVEFRMFDVHFERISDIVFTEKELTSDMSTEASATNLDDEFEPIKGVVKAVSSPPWQSEQSSAGEMLVNMTPLNKVKKILVGNITVENLSFRFEGKKSYAFRGISFEVEAGQTVAITGPSGCGKSTLLKCLMGLIQPSEGRILIDGQELGGLSDYRCQIAGVMQDDQLISGSIAENIAFFANEIDWEHLYRCAQIAAIHSDIMTMTMQYDTLVGDLGGSLSGGQKQRLILARAIYRKPRILFMDEATSHLDVSNEMLVNNHINQLSLTRVLVAHRPETVRSAGCIIEMTNL